MLSLLFPASSSEKDCLPTVLPGPLTPLRLHGLPQAAQGQPKCLYWQQATGMNDFVIGQYYSTPPQQRSVLWDITAPCAVLYYSLQGDIFVQVQREQKVFIPAGQYGLLIFPAKMKVRTHLAAGYHHAVHISFPIPLLQQLFDAQIMDHSLSLRSTTSLYPFLPTLSITRGILSIWDRCLSADGNVHPFCFFQLNEGCLKLLSRFVRDVATARQQQYWKQRKGLRAEELESYLADHLDVESRRLTTETICARKIGMSRYQFRKFWKERTGQTLGQYLLQRRMEKAKQALLGGAATPATLFLQVGYQDFSSFSRAFSSWFGFPPSQAERALR